MQSRAKRKVRKAVAKVKSFLFLLRILKSSVRPVMTASMPPIWKMNTGSKSDGEGSVPRMSFHNPNWTNDPIELCTEQPSSLPVTELQPCL